MDQHVQRVCEPLFRGWDEFVADRATLEDLSRLAGHARQALDGSTDPLTDLLWVAELELLALYDEGGRGSDKATAKRYLEPVFEQMGHRI